MTTSTPSLFAAGGSVLAAFLQSLQPQPWTALTLKNSWSNAAGVVAAQCRMFGAVELEIIGAMNPGTISAGVQIAQIPDSSWYPNSTQSIVWTYFGTNSSAAGMLEINTSGALLLYNFPSGGTGLGFHGFVALDA